VTYFRRNIFRPCTTRTTTPAHAALPHQKGGRHGVSAAKVHNAFEPRDADIPHLRSSWTMGPMAESGNSTALRVSQSRQMFHEQARVS